MKKIVLLVVCLVMCAYSRVTCAERADIIKSSPNYLIILVHGITSDHKAFDGESNLKRYLIGDLGLDGYVYAYDYSNNRQSNDKNAKELGDPDNSRYWIGRAKEEFASDKGYSSFEAIPQNLRPSKIVLIAHSMGGLSSRVYITSGYYQNDVKKLITLDTPHTGADIISFLNKYWIDMAKEASLVGVQTQVMGYDVDLSNKSIDSMIKKNITDRISGFIKDKTTSVTDSFTQNLFSIPLWANIEKDSAHWAVDLEMPSPNNNAVQSWLEDKHFVPVWTGTFAQAAQYLVFSGKGYDEMDPDGSWINDLRRKSQKAGTDPISYRLVSSLGNPTPNKEAINRGGFLATADISWQLMPFMPEWNALPNESAKYWAITDSVIWPGLWPLKDGSLLVAEDSSRGDDVPLFKQNTKRYSYDFKSDKLEDNIKACQTLYYILLGLALTPPYVVPMPIVHNVPMITLTVLFAATTADDLASQTQSGVLRNHEHIIWASCNSQTDGPPIIDLALFDTPMATVTHLDTDVSIDAYNMTQKIEHMPGAVQSVAILNSSEASDNPPYAADRSVSLIFNEGTTSEVEKYTSSMLVKVPVTQISGVIHDFKPLMLESFQISENFAAWQDFKPNTVTQHTGPNGFKYIETTVNKFTLHMDEWGRYTISGLNFAEGQNLIAFKLRNRAQYSSNQVCKVIQNTIPMQASKFQPESNFMTNNVYQPIGVEFNKSTYYEDAIGHIDIMSMLLDGQEISQEANIVSTLVDPYHPVATVEYIPKSPLQDGLHNILVQAKSDVGVSQAIWSFFVDTQPPSITIEALPPYSPRAPNAQPISIRYKTADNLSTFLRNGSINVYDKNNNFVTEISTFDTQAVGDNYAQWDGRRVTGSTEEVVPDGNYTIKIQAYDYAGNLSEESVSLTIDSTPPTIINADVDPKPMTSNSDSLNFSTELTENSIVTIKLINKSTGVASAYIAQATGASPAPLSAPGRGDGGEVATASYAWSYNNQFGISGPEDGVYSIEVTAQDAAGNVSDPYTIDNVRIDRTPPVIFANACLPYVLANVGDNPYMTTLSYQVSESNDKAENQGQGLGVSVKLFNENTGEMVKMWSNAPSDIGPINSINWDGNSSQYVNGAYKFAITATDAYGNSSTAYSTCVKDGIAPIISFPVKDQTVSGTIAIRGTAVDPDWTNNLPFKDYKIYYARGNLTAPVNLDNLSGDWKSDFVEVPEINRSRDVQSQAPGGQNTSIRPLQNDSTLAYLYSNGLENGTYTLLLIADEDGGKSMACTRVIEVHNDPMIVSTDVPAVKLNPLPQKVHFTADGKITLPISFVNGIKKSNVNIEVIRSRDVQSQAPVSNEAVAFYKYQPGVIGNQYTGKPSYQPGQNLGYYIWTDETGWHIRWSSDGTNHHFTGSLMGSGISNIKTINWNPSGQIQSFINWDNSISNGEAGIDFTADNGAMLMITPKIDEDPSAPSFYADKIFMGMTNATQSYLPIMINTSAEGVAPEVVNWDGKLETGGFADSGIYTVRVRSEGADGVGLATDEAQVEVETDYDVSNVEAVNQSFSPVGAPDRVSIYYNVSKDSYITAYVYQNPVISLPLPLPNTDGTLVATITSEAFVSGNLNPDHRHVLTWRGNYPNPDSSQFFTGGSFNIKIIATAADGSGQKEVPVGGIKISQMDTNSAIAELDPIGEQVPFNGSPSWIANGSSNYYFEAKGNGRLFPPKTFSFSLTPYGKQMPTTYPYVPFAMLIHRGYKQVNVRMSGWLRGAIREHFTEGSAGASEQIHTEGFSVGLDEMKWGFRSDKEEMNTPAQKGPYAIYLRGRSVNSIYGGRNTGATTKFYGGQTFSLSFNTWNVGGSGDYFLDSIDNIPVADQFDIEIPSTIEQQGDEAENSLVNDVINARMNNMTLVYPSTKGMFKVEINRDDFIINKHTDAASISGWLYTPRRRVATVQPPLGKNGSQFWCRARVMPEAPVQYSRLTNRFLPFFGFINKNASTSETMVAPNYNIDQLGFPGDAFFNKSDAKPYNEYNEMLASAAARQNMSEADLIKALSDLKIQKNYLGTLTSPTCTASFEYYLSDPITGEYGIEFIPITKPEKGAFEIDFDPNSRDGSYTINATTTYEMSYNSNPPSLFAFNFPATDNEKQNFIDKNAQLLDKFRKSPSLWTGIGVDSPHELDTSPNSVTTSIETEQKLGQAITYGPGGYIYTSPPLGEMYGAATRIPSNACNIKYNWGGISDQSVTLNLDNTTEASGGAQLRGTITGDQGLRWTTADDPILYPYGGVIRSGRLSFNKDGFSGISTPPWVISDSYTAEVINSQNLNSPNMIKYTFWKYNALTTTIDAYDPVDNQYLVYDDWDISLKDLSGAENSDLVPLDVTKGNTRLEDNFQVKLKLDSAEKKFVEIKGSAAGEYDLMFFDGTAWRLITHSDSGKTGTLGWWNVSRLNGKYTVLLKVGDVISTQDIMIGSIVKPQDQATVTSPYRRAEVTFKAGTFPNDQLVTVTPVRMDQLDISNKPLIPTVGPIVEVKPSPYYFSTGTSTSEDMRPTLVFRYTKDDLKEMYPKLNVDSTEEVAKLGLNIHQITEKGDLQIISDNKQSYNNGLYAFEGPLDHFSDYALIRGSYNLKAPLVLTDKYIINSTPITVYGTAQAESILNIYVSSSKEGDINSLEPIAAQSLGSDESGIAAFKFEKIPLIIEGNNYIFVTSTQGNATTESCITVKYDITPPTAEASVNIPAFSPNGDGKFDVVDYTIKSNETGKLYFIIKDPKGDTVLNKEFDCKADEGIKVEWDGTDQNSHHCSDGDYTYVAFAVDGAGNISNNVTGQTIIDTIPPKVSNISVNPYSFTPNGDGINDTTTISFEVNEQCYTTITFYRNNELYFDHGFTCPLPLAPCTYSWDGKGNRNELIGGTYTFNIVAEDSVGNISTSETATVYVDRAAFLVDYAYGDPMYFSPKNPKNDSTKITYNLSRDNLKVDINIYDGLGNVIASPAIGETKMAGVNGSIWDGSDKSGNKVQNGTYGFKVRAVDPVDGASGEVTGNVIVDNDPPTIAINSVDVFDDSAKVTYSIPEESKVTISVIDQSGQVISELVTAETQMAGSHQSSFYFPLPVTRYSSSLSFKIYAEDKALNSDEKTSSQFTVPGPLEIYDASAAPVIFNPNSQIINKYTTIRYRLAAKSGQAQVMVKALSEAGATIKALVDRENESNGTYSSMWYGDDLNNNTVPAGNYNIEISAVDGLGNTAKQEIPVIVAADSSSVLSVSPEVFSPNGSGIADTTMFTYSVDYYWQLTGEANIELDVMDQNGNIVYVFADHHTKGVYTTAWDGSKQTINAQGVVTSVGTVSDGMYVARIKLTDPAGTIVYSNSIPVKADIHVGLSLPASSFVTPWAFTPNGDGQADTASFTYYLDEPSYVTIKVHKYNGAGPYDDSNRVWTIADNVLTSAGTQTAVWNGSSEGVGDADGNGYADKGEYAFIIQTVDTFGNISPKRGATVWVQDVPINFDVSGILTENPTPKVFSSNGCNTKFAFNLMPLNASGESQEPEKFEITAKKIMAESYYNIGKVTIKVYDSGGGLAKTLLDKQVVDNSGIRYITCEGAGLSEGKYTIIASAEDLTGVPAINSTSGVAYVDSTPPVIYGVSLSRNCFSPGSNCATISYEVSDNLSSITTDVPNRIRTTIKVYDPSGGLVKTITDIPTVDSGTASSSVWDGSLDSGSFEGSGKPDGTYTIKISAVDVAGNTSEAAQDIIVDTTKPSIESVSVSPDPFSPGGAKPNSNISANISDANSVTWEVKIETGASPVVSMGTGTSLNYTWNGMNGSGTYEGDGSYNCLITAYDAAGNSNQVTKVITTDTIAPVITAEARPKVFNSYQIPSLEVIISDANPHLTYNVTFAGGSISASSESNYLHDYITLSTTFSSEADGNYDFIVVATDEAGNTASTIETVSLDNTLPTVSFTSPEADTWQKGTFNIYGTISDAHPGNWTLDYSGGVIGSGSGNKAGELLGAFNSSALNSQVTVYLIATDEVGNQTVMPRTFNIDDTPPVIFNVTSEVGTQEQAFFNPYINGGIDISFEVTDNSTGYSNQHPAARITASAEVWLGATLVKNLSASIYGTSEVIWTTDWDGKNTDGNYVNEGVYTLRLTAADILNNISTYEYTIKLEDDQQITTLGGASYSHDPNLKLVNGQLSLRFITGECWGMAEIISKWLSVVGRSTCEQKWVSSIQIEQPQTITIEGSWSVQVEDEDWIYWEGFLNDDSGANIWDVGGRHHSTTSLSDNTNAQYAMRYQVIFWFDSAKNPGTNSYGEGSGDMTVKFQEKKYNCIKTSKLDNLQDINNASSAISDGDTYEPSASNGVIEHFVWPSKFYLVPGDGPSPGKGPYIYSNNYEIIYNKKVNGELNYGYTGNTWYPIETNISSADGDSINPSIACDSSGNKVYVVWEDWRNNKGEIFFRSSLNSGESWPDNANPSQYYSLSSSISQNCSYPSITCDPTGQHIYVVFSRDNNGHKELYFTKNDNAGDQYSWQGPVRITRSEFTNCNAFRPSLVASTDGSAYVAWEDTRTGTSEIFFQKIPHNFAPFTSSGMTTLSMPSKAVIAAPITIMSASSTIELVSPINSSLVKTLRPIFRWYGLQDLKDYKIECALASDEASLSGTLDYFTTTISNVSSAKPLCEYIVPEHSMGLDESSASHPYWYWRVKTINTTEATTSEVGSFRIELPVSLSSVTNWPNPFNPNKENTKIRYRLGREADSVTIKIYDITGALVRELDGTCNAEGASIWNKYNDVEWDGRNGRGDMVLNGVYPFEVSVSCGNKTETGRGKIVILK